MSPPTVRLRPMTEEEYDAFRIRGVSLYAEDLARSRGLSPAAALQVSEETFDRTLAGAAAPDRTWVLRVLDDSDAASRLALARAASVPRGRGLRLRRRDRRGTSGPRSRSGDDARRRRPGSRGGTEVHPAQRLRLEHQGRRRSIAPSATSPSRRRWASRCRRTADSPADGGRGASRRTPRGPARRARRNGSGPAAAALRAESFGGSCGAAPRQPVGAGRRRAGRADLRVDGDAEGRAADRIGAAALRAGHARPARRRRSVAARHAGDTRRRSAGARALARRWRGTGRPRPVGRVHRRGVRGCDGTVSTPVGVATPHWSRPSCDGCSTPVSTCRRTTRFSLVVQHFRSRCHRTWCGPTACRRRAAVVCTTVGRWRVSTCVIGAGGRISIGGPVVFAGYRLRPDLTAAALVDGRHVTADLGAWTADGRLEVRGRVDDVIVSGGVNVPAAMVEAVLSEHPLCRGCRGRRRAGRRVGRAGRGRGGRRRGPGCCAAARARRSPRVLRRTAGAGGHSATGHPRRQAADAGLGQARPNSGA